VTLLIRTWVQEDKEMATEINSRILATINLMLIAVLFCPSAYSRTVYVDDDAAGANNGTSWANAYVCLQDALAIAQSGDEIRVAQGIYKPDLNVVTARSPHVVATGDRTATFQLKNGVSIRGGYAGNGEPDPDARDIQLYKTILSGDLNGDDASGFTSTSEENSYHVVTGSGADEMTILDGLTITGAYANGPLPYDHGGGMYNDAGSPTVANCTFSKNYARQHGGGMDNSDSHPMLINCAFIGNVAELKYGGGIRNYNSAPTLINCIFSGNSGGSQAGAMFNHDNSNANLINCTLSGNVAGDSGGISNVLESNPTLTNCILWGNLSFGGSHESVQIQGGTPVLNYCCIMGWTGILGGTGNHGLDPLFVDFDGPDDIPGTEDDDLHLLPDSPCIDAGDNSAIPQSVSKDLDGKPRIARGTVDMGAYEADVAYAANIFYVDADAPGDNDGSSWFNAYLCLQDALAVAQYGDEIRVANGEYKPDQRAMTRRDRWQTVSSSDWTATFQLIDGVTIKGGYAGFGELDPDARDVERYKTVLNGDLNGDDGPGFTNIEDNSYQVVTAAGTQSSAVLDGFHITGGNADGPFPYDHGGGIYNVEGSPTLIDCTITGNTTTGYGGGIHNIKNSNPVLVNCTFSNNEAYHGGGMFNDVSNPSFLNCIFTGNSAYGGFGGGMHNYGSNPTLTNCKFVENSAEGGGGMYNKESEPMLSDCAFSRNLSTGSGGGMFNEDGNPVLLSCIFSGNSAPRRSGGGMYNRFDSQPTLINCLFIGNSAINGGAMDNIHTSSPMLLNCTICANAATEAQGGGISNFQDARPILVNCIVWNNSDVDGIAATAQISGFAEVRYSCIQGTTSINPWAGAAGNINEDPLFPDPENGDYHLKSQAGRWDPAGQSWVIDQISSPCIDAGDPGDSVGLERFPNGFRINMGAYGGTREASLSPAQSPTVYGKASNPYPADGARNVDINVTLSWTAGFEGALHTVYLGTDFDQVRQSNLGSTLVGQQSSTNYDPGTLDYNQTYYWRIDEVDNQGTTVIGEVWSFTTASFPGTPKGRSCFAANTPVWVGGAFIPISEVTSGNISTDVHGSNRIEELQEHTGAFVCYDILLESGNCLAVAENHYFLAESEEWISLKNLEAGTKLKTAKGSIGIVSVTKRPMPYTGKVYNLKIDGSDRYLVGKDAIVVRDY
jgi:hypothetical protein